MTTQTPATAEIEEWLRIRFFTNFWLWTGPGSEKKTQNPAGVDCGTPVSSEISDLCEISDLLLLVSYFTSPCTGIKFVAYFLTCVKKVKTFLLDVRYPQQATARDSHISTEKYW